MSFPIWLSILADIKKRVGPRPNLGTQRLASHDPANAQVANVIKIGLCGKPGPPNSGSRPSAPGK